MGELHKGPQPSEGGSYTFDEDTLTSLIKDWDELIDSFNDSLTNVDLMTDVVGPGDDPASLLFAEAANKSGQSYRDAMIQKLEFCIEQRNLFRKTLDQYLLMEDRAAAGFDQIMPGGSLPEV